MCENQHEAVEKGPGQLSTERVGQIEVGPRRLPLKRGTSSTGACDR